MTAGTGWLRRLLGYCWRHRRGLVIAMSGAFAAMAATAVVPLMERVIIDDVIVTPRVPLVPWAIGLLVAAIVVFGGSYLRRYYGGRLALDVQYDLRTELFQSVSRFDGARQDELDTGQLVGRSTSDLTLVQGMLGMVPYSVTGLLQFVVALVVMLTLSPLLTVVALAVVPALWFVALRSRARLFPATWDAQQQAGEVAGVVEAAVTGVRVVKGFGQEGQELGKLETAGQSLFAKRLRALRLNSRYTPALQSVPALGQVGVLALGGWLAARNHITLGTFLAFSTYLAQLSGPVRMLSGLITIGQQARASVVRVFEVIDTAPLVTEKPDAADIDLDDSPDAISFDDVTFGYLPSQPVLRDMSLHVRAGETVALVGASGSGKSTVSMLLPRFYDVQEGALRVGADDVRDLRIDSLRAAIGMVAEESFLFSESVADNIAYGRPEATREQIAAAARAAEADGFISRLPDGYDTVVGEQGLTLSGGQRQRVALARALLTDPRILLLDDATSAVDARVEAEIHDTLRRVMRDRTTLLIAHRKSTLQLADRIAVLEGGRVVAIGTHAELTRTCGLYRLLLSGPGDDAETVEVQPVDDPRVDGVTPALWDPARAPDPSPATALGSGVAPAAGRAAGQMRGAGGGTRALAALPATPDLLEKVEKLPPATDPPDVDDAYARAAEPRFSLRGVLSRFRGPLLAGLVLVALDALAGLALPALMRNGIDQGVEHGQYAAVLVASAIALVVALVDWVVQIGQIRVTGRMGERILYTLRVKIFAHLQRLGLDYYEREMTGRIMTRMTTDVDALSSFLQTGLVTAVVSVLSFAGILVALIVLDSGLALVVLCVLPVMIVATLVFRTKASAAYQEARDKVSVVNADLQENVSGLRVAQAFRREDHNRARFARRSADYRNTRTRAQRYIGLYFPFVQFLSTVAAALVLWAGADRVHAGTLTVGALIAYLLYIDLFFSPVQQLSQVFDGYQQAAVGVSRIRDLLRTPTSTPESPDPRPAGRLRGEIVLDDVHFSYISATHEALSGVGVRIEPGQTVALVGETGAGKSTLVKMVARFYDVTEGAVRVDGVDVRSYDLASYRQRLGVVPQESYLFSGNIRDAIAYGRPSATPAEIESAARSVGAHDMIATFPGGYLQPVGERGRSLSAGERQLIALARAQLVDPDILLLDEATAALDLATEARVTEATEALTHRRTTLVVAHRLTTAARADRIIVLADGRIVEDGDHATLLASGGAYAEMWQTFTGDTVLT
ncbi:MAG TPA: ABC transporter ATP-binding protein [Streptosporangiaceae bacterium]|jgi:ATP-binding cassette subfamily B protein